MNVLTHALTSVDVACLVIYLAGGCTALALYKLTKT